MSANQDNTTRNALIATGAGVAIGGGLVFLLTRPSKFEKRAIGCLKSLNRELNDPGEFTDQELRAELQTAKTSATAAIDALQQNDCPVPMTVEEAESRASELETLEKRSAWWKMVCVRTNTAAQQCIGGPLERIADAAERLGLTFVLTAASLVALWSFLKGRGGDGDGRVHRLAIRVKDTAGDAISRAKAVISDATGTVVAEPEADASGRMAVVLTEGMYTVAISASEFKPETQQVSLVEDMAITATLAAAAVPPPEGIADDATDALEDFAAELGVSVDVLFAAAVLVLVIALFIAILSPWPGDEIAVGGLLASELGMSTAAVLAAARALPRAAMRAIAGIPV